MGQIIRVGGRDDRINHVLKSLTATSVPTKLGFNQNEEFFLEFQESFSVPSFGIHHDVSRSEPDPAYLECLLQVVRELAGIAPGVFAGLIYYFDPTDILGMRFFQVYHLADRSYLYRLRVDLGYRAQEHELLDAGNSTTTPHYRSNRLFAEALMIPLDRDQSSEENEFEVTETFSETWLGERGRGFGYWVQGVWIDHDLTKFFSKLFLPSGVRSYPFYPFVCRYRTLCQTIVDLSPQGRQKGISALARALTYISPAKARIEQDLRDESFSTKLPVFRELKDDLPEAWEDFYGDLKVSAYLNHRDMKEFKVEMGLEAG